ncbi:MAG: Rab family GTPase [Candidatus Hodarchaeota archaeon]
MIKHEFTWKICIVGDPACGKTSLVSRYTNRSFDKFYQPTLGAQFSVKSVDLDEKYVAKVYIWDIAGQTKFNIIRKMFYEQSKAVIFVYDVTNKTTFRSVDHWRADLIDALGDNFPSALLGNKVDLVDERVVPTEEGFEKATDFQIPFYETSALTGEGVDDAFLNLLLMLHDKDT